MAVNLKIQQPISKNDQVVSDESGNKSALFLSNDGISVNGETSIRELLISGKEPKDAKTAQLEINAIEANDNNNPLPQQPPIALNPIKHYMSVGRTMSYGFIQLKKWDPALVNPATGLIGAWVTNAVPLVLNPLGGNVGIGTIKPSAALDVAGNILTTGRMGIRTVNPREALDVNGNVFVTGDIRMNGDIKLLGADCAENFDVDELQDLEPGTVMVIGDELKLFQCVEAYDKRVAGVLSGAGAYQPGIVLDQQQSTNKRMPLALTGKVYCKVDAQYGPISIGDLLTTSPTIGHAMKALDPLKAFGAVIGKALRPLTSGQGLIPVLVALQ